MNWSAPPPVSANSGLRICLNFLHGLSQRRHLIWNFVRRDLRARYVGSLVGFFWSVLHPLVLLVSYNFVFSVVFQIRPQVRTTDNFAVFLFCGILPWLYFQDTLLRACQSVTENSNLIRKTLFPSEVLPLTIALSNSVTHVIGLLILAGVLLYLGLLGPLAGFIPLYFILLGLLALGFGWLLSAIQVFLRDTAQLLSVVLIFWFWFTPIFYTLEMVPESLQVGVYLNPLTHVVEAYRRLLLENRLPELSSTLLLVGYAVTFLALGGWVFRSTKREFVDVL